MMDKKIDIGFYNDDHDLAIHNSEQLKIINENLERLLKQLSAFAIGLSIGTNVSNNYADSNNLNEPLLVSPQDETINALLDITNYIGLNLQYTNQMRSFITDYKDLKLIDYQIDLNTIKDDLVNIYLGADDRNQFEQQVEKYIKQKFDKYGKQNLPF